jgi:steroid 5-alpha reductase family enzyme
MNDTPTALLVAAGAIVALMLVTWLVSVARRDASIVDIVWGLGFAVVAWAVFATTDGNQTRRILLVAMTTIWGLRLATHLFVRNRGKGEDHRYQAMRRRYGGRFAVVSLYVVFGLQGVLMWIVSLSLQLGQTRETPDVGVIAWIGIAVWAFGIYFEAVGDWQLARFKRDPANAGKVMDQGLWRYTRHPNYFGDACVWWGIALVAAETGIGAIGLVGALVMTVLLRRVSGVTLLERSLVKRRPGYDAYVARTSPFVPRRPRG